MYSELAGNSSVYTRIDFVRVCYVSWFNIPILYWTVCPLFEVNLINVLFWEFGCTLVFRLLVVTIVIFFIILFYFCFCFCFKWMKNEYSVDRWPANLSKANSWNVIYLIYYWGSERCPTHNSFCPKICNLMFQYTWKYQYFRNFFILCIS
jgi:hypothetical protein